MEQLQLAKEEEEAKTIKGMAKRKAKGMFQSIKKITQKQEQVSFANDAFFLTHGDDAIEEYRAPGEEALYVDQLTPEEIAGGCFMLSLP